MSEDPVLLYAHPSMAKLAKQIADKCSGECTDSQVKRFRVERGLSRFAPRTVEYHETIEWKKFNDGFPNLFIKDVRQMAGKDILFIGSFHSPEVIFEQISILYAMPRYLAKSFHFILPYFPTGTMERVDYEGQIATAKTLATLLSNIPLSSKGPAQIMILDIHALQERFYFSENVIPRLETAVPLLKKALENFKDKKNLVFAFPDDGAHKRFHSQFSDYELIICSKIREGNLRIVQIKEGDPKGKHVVIVDDLVQTGGTLIQCGKCLLDKGALSISAYVTHAVFPKESWKKFIGNSVQFQNFWITDSIPHAAEISQHNPRKLGMERSENIPIGDYTKAVLVKELQECNIINTRLETELNKRKILAQKNEFKCDNKSFSTEKLTEIVEEDKTVLKELAVQYKQLYELNGCDTKLCSNDDGLADGAAQAKPPDCDCKKVEEIKDALLKLLNDNYELCGILKENIKILHVKVKYYPHQEVIPNGRDVVPPNIISELVNDICEEMDQILKICKTLWDVADRSSGHLRDSGIETGITDSLDSLVIKSNASSGNFWVDPSKRSASEHTDDQTDLKSLD